LDVICRKIELFPLYYFLLAEFIWLVFLNVG
jgi:hypothetical protein